MTFLYGFLRIDKDVLTCQLRLQIHILEAPTGFGKSPVAIAVAMTLGSYMCTSTNDLQTQYSMDFLILK